MRDAFELWQWRSSCGEQVGVFDSVESAIESTRIDRSEWVPSAARLGGFHVPLPDGDRTSMYQSWAVSPIRVPEADADRIELAIELALEDGQVDGDHHKMWVIDQMVRLLAGDRYEQVISEYRDGEDGPETYHWDTGIAP